MKPIFLHLTRPSFAGHPTRCSTSAVIVALAAAALLATPAFAQENQLEVGVRSAVTDKTHLWSKDKLKVPGDGGHSKLYGILKVEEIKSNWRLVKPVDENYITNLLIMQMEANGFHQIVARQRPDIIIIMSYGRGELANPYLQDEGEVGGSGVSVPVNMRGDGTSAGGDSGNAPTQSLTGGMAKQMMDEKTPGYEAKIQKASFEKLFIRVTAFDFPKDRKMKMLWKSVMVVDDPDHRDLNIVAAKMLEAGAPLFDRQAREPEVEVMKPLPTGRVNVGTPEVVGSDVQKTK